MAIPRTPPAGEHRWPAPSVDAELRLARDGGPPLLVRAKDGFAALRCDSLRELWRLRRSVDASSVGGALRALGVRRAEVRVRDQVVARLAGARGLRALPLGVLRAFFTRPAR